MIIRCDICEYLYDDCDDAAVSDHVEAHETYVTACVELNYRPRIAKARDQLYLKAIRLIKRFDIGSQIRGSLLLIRRSYDHSLYAAIMGDYYRQHPKFEEYMSMTHFSFSQIPDEIKAHFLEEYGMRRNEIAPGYRTWYPKYSVEREEQFAEYQRYYSLRNSNRMRRTLLGELERMRRRH